MEAVECGAASLAIILGYFGRIVPLAEIRRACDISRDGSRVSNILQVARAYGLQAKAFKREIPALAKVRFPYIVHWKFKHFLVVEGYRNGRVYLNDPATGPRWVSSEQFHRDYTGITLEFQPAPDFVRGGEKLTTTRGLWRRLRKSVIPALAAVFTAVLLVVPGIAMPALMAAFVDKVLIQGRHDWGRPLVLGMCTTLALRAFVTSIQFRILRRFHQRLAVTETSRFFRHLLTLPIHYYSQRHPGDVSNRIALNDKVADILSGRLATASVDGLMMLVYVGVMWRVSPVLTAVPLFFATANILVLAWWSRHRLEQTARLAAAQSRLASTASSGLQSIRTIKASALEHDFFARWAGHFAEFSYTSQGVGQLNYFLAVLPTLTTAMLTCALLAIGGMEVVSGRLSIGLLVAFQSLALSFLLPLNNLLSLSATVQDLKASLDRLDDVLETPSDEEAVPEPVMSNLPDRLLGHVEFRNVTFGFSPVSPPLIHNLSFELHPGQRVAFVGGSGSGKTTIVRLMTGIYKPLFGEILFDGIPTSQIRHDVLANSVAMVDQDVVLFHGSVRDNLTLWDTTVPTDRVQRACADAQIDSVLDALPEGLSTELLEGGANLSGGQRQRLEIARALAGNPSILVLDEATSALDAETERLVDRKLRRRGCTCVIVAHRLSTVRDSDQILVLDKGKLVQSGTHDQLIREEGVYAGLFNNDAELAIAIPARKP